MDALISWMMMRRLPPLVPVLSLCVAMLAGSAASDPAPGNNGGDLVAMYLNGQGQPSDYPAIYALCQAQASAGNAVGERCLGYMYAHGNGVTQNVDQALHWWREAALQEDVGAQNALGSTYQFGHDVPIDCPEAAKWYAMAADQGSPAAMFFLGQMAAAGICEPGDDVSALSWLDLALARLDATTRFAQSATQIRAQLLARMNDDQRSRALAREQSFRAYVHVPPTGVTVLKSLPTANPAETCTQETDPTQRIYPDAAQRMGMTGSGHAACRVSGSGIPLQCTWTDEDPSGYGFGSAAASAACRVKFDRPASTPAGPEWFVANWIRFAMPKD